MDKFAHMTVLLDIYGGLLTPKQGDVMDLYYNYDLSLAEIAEQYGISRQGVHDLIKRAEQTLNDVEDKVGAAKRWIYIEDILNNVIGDMDNILNQLNAQEFQKTPEDIKSEIKEWKGILEKLLN